MSLRSKSLEAFLNSRLEKMAKECISLNYEAKEIFASALARETAAELYKTIILNFGTEDEIEGGQ